MIIFEYICYDCDYVFERVVLNKIPKEVCPKCGSLNTSFQVADFDFGKNCRGCKGCGGCDKDSV